MASPKTPNSPNSYIITLITTLPIKHAIIKAILNKEYIAPTSFNRYSTNANVYTQGHIGEYNIIIISLIARVYRTTLATTIALSLLVSLPSIYLSLFTSIGGGIPSESCDIWLSDIIVSQPNRTTGGVYQYNLIKVKLGNKYKRKGFLRRPLIVLLNALTKIQAIYK